MLLKVLISKKKAWETRYWLKLLEEFTNSPDLVWLQEECQEIILSSYKKSLMHWIIEPFIDH